MNQSALDLAIQIHPDLWQIKDLLCHDELDELLCRVYKEDSWKKQELQENLSREVAVWEANGLSDWVWTKLSDLDFSRFGLTFRTVMIWRDHEGYTISNHADNERVTAAMQIYLSPSQEKIGTWFLDKIEIPFVQNTGYLMHNRNKIIHGMKNAVPLGYTRLSFYALFDVKS